MNWLDRFVIAPLAPRAALNRARARYALRGFYEIAQPSRTRKRVPDSGSVNNVVNRAGPILRTRARQLEENLDIAKGALDILVANVVGRGIQPEPQVKTKDGQPATQVNDDLVALWKDWIKAPEVTGEHDYYSAQRIAARSLFRDGEMLAQLISGTVAKLNHNTKVPFSLELLEADFLPFEYSDSTNNIFNGIQVNEWRRPIVYNIWKQHPGDALFFGVSEQIKQIPAARMIHLKLMHRLHQLRGVTIFASVAGRLDDIKEIDETERVAARVAAAMAMYIKKGTPDIYQAPIPDADGHIPRAREFDVSPGTVFDNLLPGEDVGSIVSNRPNNALIPFRDSQLRAGAAGLMTSFSSLSKNYNGTYSAQRQELVEQYGHYGVLAAYFIARFCVPVWENFVNAAIASGQLKITPDIDRATLTEASHTPPQMPWIDPVKEATANALLEDRLYKSRSQIIRERGGVPDQTLHEISRDRDAANALGLTPTLTNAAATPKTEDAGGGTAPIEPDEPIDPNAPPDPSNPPGDNNK